MAFGGPSSKARKTQVRFVSNASAFEVKRTCVFSKMYLRFGENAKAFDMKHFGVLKFITILVKRNIKDLKCSDLWRRQRLYVF